MADNDGPSSIALQAGVPALSISSNSSINTEADGAEPQSIPIGPIRTEVNGVGSQDFAYSGMDVDGDDNYVNGSGSGGGEAANSGTANNNDNVDATDSKSEAGTTASGDAQTGQSDLDDTSTVDSAIEGLAMHEHSKEMVPEEAESPNSYKSRIQARHSILRAGVPAYASAQKYTFNPVYNIPQNTVQTNALAIPPCSSHLFTGGSDGYVRRYGWYASLRNLPSERYPVLQGYWENLSITAIQARGLLWNATMQEDPSRIRFGPAGVSGGTTVPVHSLVVQKDELYCLAGSAEGVINLYSVRLDEGQCRACLGITGKGHKRNTPVSALALSEGDSTLISGGWDSQVLQWDLNTGQCTREYVAHKNTVVAVVFRPPASDNIPTDLTWGRQNEQHSSALGVPRNQGLAGDASDDTAKSGQSSKAETTLPSNSSSKLLNKSGARDFEAGSSASYDPLFDDDNDGGTAGPSRMNSPTSAAMEMTNTTDSAAPSGGLNLPGLNMSDSSSGPSLATLLALGDTKAAQNASVPTPAKLPQITRPTIPSFADKTQENLAPFPPPSHHLENTDIFLSCSVDGECLVWDRTAERANVRRLDLPKGCPPWCVSATWSPTGNVIYVGRRNASITIYDLRTATMETLHLPTSSGKVTGIHAMRDNRHLLVSSSDTVRLYNLETRKFTIVSNMGGSSSPGSPAVSSSANGAGAPGSNVNGAGAGAAAGVNTGVPSNATLTGAAAAAAAATLVNAANGAFTTFVADPREKYLFATYGNRGLLESGREEIATFEIQVST